MIVCSVARSLDSVRQAPGIRGVVFDQGKRDIIMSCVPTTISFQNVSSYH
jgi:hypothetical protein